jgi:hypothetical protein
LQAWFRQRFDEGLEHKSPAFTPKQYARAIPGM